VQVNREKTLPPVELAAEDDEEEEEFDRDRFPLLLADVEASQKSILSQGSRIRGCLKLMKSYTM
jgi:hypothetical protein